jgi:hypothetical protein
MTFKSTNSDFELMANGLTIYNTLGNLASAVPRLQIDIHLSGDCYAASTELICGINCRSWLASGPDPFILLPRRMQLAHAQRIGGAIRKVDIACLGSWHNPPSAMRETGPEMALVSEAAVTQLPEQHGAPPLPQQL